MTLRTRDLDFVPPPLAARRLVPWLMIALTCALIAWRADQHAGQLATTELLQVRHDTLSMRLNPSRAKVAVRPNDPATQQRIAKAQAVLARLALPWDSLFAAIEAADSRSLALLALEPNARDATVRISGEARSITELLAYVNRLAQQPALSEVHLLGYDAVRREGAQVFSFSVLARWSVS